MEEEKGLKDLWGLKYLGYSTLHYTKPYYAIPHQHTITP
jgi:hypothetical protein